MIDCIGVSLSLSSEIEYVGGPLGASREARAERADSIPAPGGSYRRSVACADDGVVRYVWSAAPDDPSSTIRGPSATACRIVAP